MNSLRPLVGLVLLISLSTVNLLAQSSAARAAKKAGGVIAGRVTANGKGLPGITVTLRNSGFGGQTQGQNMPQARTDADGKYRITDITMGSYFVTPAAPVYTIPGAGRLTSANQAVVITGSETVDGIDFALVRGGVITGKVTDPESRPIIEQSVSLQNVDESAQRGGPQNMAPGAFRTDDRGIYRIYGVPPGRYTVSVGAQQRFTSYSTIMGQQAYKQTFYPDTTDASQATPVEVNEGTELSNVDITVGRTVDQYSVTGHVVDRDTNAPVPNIGFTLSVLSGGNRQRAMGMMALPVVSDGDGQFRVDNVAPGRYSIAVAPQTGTGMSGQSSPFDVINQDVTGVEVRAVKGATVSGVVALDQNQDPSILAELMQFQLQVFAQGGSGGGAASAQTVPLNADGSFNVTGLPAGTVRLSLFAQDPALQGAFKLLRTELGGVPQPRGIVVNAGDQVTGVRLVAAYADGIVEGVVKVLNGALTPGSRIFARLSSTQGQGQGPGGLGANVDERGHFLIQNVPAGLYNLTVSVNDQARRGGQPQQPPVKSQQPVTVTEGQVSNITVVLDLGQHAPPAPGQ